MSPEQPRKTFHELFIQWNFLDLVVYQGKRVEVRLATPVVLSIQQGDSLRLSDSRRRLDTKVLSATPYANINLLVAAENPELVYPGKTREDLHSMGSLRYGTNKLVAIQFEPLARSLSAFH